MDDKQQFDGAGPVLAVLPFAAPGGSPETALIAHGLHEDICAELTRFHALRIISPNSAAAAVDLDDAEIGRRLGASHAFRGRVRQAGNRLELSASLSACALAQQIWSERIDVDVSGVHGLEAEVIAQIAAMLHAQLEALALAEARRRPEGLAVYPLIIQGMTLLREGSLPADEAARELFRTALELDPQSPRAHAGLALSWFNEWGCQFWDRFEETTRAAYESAHKALALDDRDAALHLVLGRIHLYRRDFERASWYLDRAHALCPNDAELLIQLALCEAFLGRPEVGVQHAERAMRLNPFHPASYYGYAAMAQLIARDFEASVALAARVDALPFVDIPAYWAVAHASLGQLEAARRQLDTFVASFREKILFGREPAPGEAIDWFLKVNPFQRPEDTAFFAETLRALDPGQAARATSERPPPAPPMSAELRRSGAGWVAAYDGVTAVLPDLKGLDDIRRLLERPGEEVHCLDLADRAGTIFGADVALDDKARAAIKARIRDLEAEVEDAEEMNDPGRAERARSELERLLKALAQALGLGGRGRRLGDPAERARTTVTWRVRFALRRIEAAHAPLGRHLANAVRTGVFCVYRPERPIAWRFGA